jgi:hypothetical protein
MWGAGARQNRKIRLYKGTLDLKLSIFWIYLDLLKSNPTLFSPQVRRITGRKCGAVDRVESVDALVLTAYMTLYVIGVLIASTILAGIGTKQNYQQRSRRRT